MKHCTKKLLSLCLALSLLMTGCSTPSDNETQPSSTPEYTVEDSTEAEPSEEQNSTEASTEAQTDMTEAPMEETSPEEIESSSEVETTEEDTTAEESSTEPENETEIPDDTTPVPTEPETPEATTPVETETPTEPATEPVTETPTEPETTPPATEPETEPETEPPTEEPEPEVSIAELALQYGFTLGGCIGNSQMNDAAYKAMVSENFSSVTATNELKAYSLLSWRSQYSTDGMPVMDYTNADKIVAWAQANGIGVRGHVLVWDAYMTDWFFREGYSSSGAYVDAETMKARLEYYINEVITHFETKYPGVVYCWDVVNEAVGDSSSDYNSNDPCHIRTKRNGATNPFYQYVGEDYVQLSFLYAKNTVERLGADIKLFYNDYNTFYSDKRDAICNLVQSINTYAKDDAGNYRRLCDGVGMQGYIGGYGQQTGCMNSNDLALIKTAIVKYASLGVEVHVTEMAVRNYDPSADTVARHAEFYANLFRVFKSVNQETGGALTNVTIWGLHDKPNLSTSDYSYSMNGPYCGLFDENYERKDAFYQVYNILAQ